MIAEHDMDNKWYDSYKRKIIDAEDNNCNHIIGMNGNEDVAEIIRKSESKRWRDHRFNYCADCGEKLNND